MILWQKKWSTNSPSSPFRSHEKLFLCKTLLKNSDYDLPSRAAASRKICQLLRHQWYHCSARYNSTGAAENPNWTAAPVQFIFFAWAGSQHSMRLTCREDIGQGLSETGRLDQMPGRWGSSRGRNTELKGYWDELRNCSVWWTSAAKSTKRKGLVCVYRPRLGHWGPGQRNCAVNGMWAMLCVWVCTEMSGKGTERSCNYYSWQRGEGPQEKCREEI